jgi:hypothetical protein
LRCLALRLRLALPHPLLAPSRSRSCVWRTWSSLGPGRISIGATSTASSGGLSEKITLPCSSTER